MTVVHLHFGGGDDDAIVVPDTDAEDLARALAGWNPGDAWIEVPSGKDGAITAWVNPARVSRVTSRPDHASASWRPG